MVISPDTTGSLRAYYARRAAEYERIYHKPERQADLRAIEAWLPRPFAGRNVIEIACGTGWWTPHGARDCAHWLATDINPETIAIAETKALPPGRVTFRLIDANALQSLGHERFDAAFAGFWWSHVPLQRLAPWLSSLHAQLLPGARVVLLDNRHVAGSSTPIAHRDAHGNSYQLRVLDDGSHHEVLKNFPTREQALAAIGPQAHDAQWTDHAHYWTLTYTLR
jgi:SAM-dependent methyltransferase